MADTDTTKGADARSPDVHSSHEKKAEKRQSSDDSGQSPSPKKISMSVGPPEPVPLSNQKIRFNLSSSADLKPKTITMNKPSMKVNTAPIKIALNSSVKTKEPPPVVPKSSLSTSVFDDSDESEEEEMPPEAKMRMKNIGRNTPTASGPNSYGKGKMGFTDRHKILEKQLKEEMDKVLGDKK